LDIAGPQHIYRSLIRFLSVAEHLYYRKTERVCFYPTEPGYGVPPSTLSRGAC